MTVLLSGSFRPDGIPFHLNLAMTFDIDTPFQNSSC